MNNIKYYFEYFYNVLLDFTDLTPTDVFNMNNNTIDMIDLKIINELDKERIIRWDKFFRKYKKD
jgi:hypothetical protein